MQSYQATQREDVREAHTILTFFLLTHCSHVYTLQSTSDVLTQSSFVLTQSSLLLFLLGYVQLLITEDVKKAQEHQ